MAANSFGARSALHVGEHEYEIYRLEALHDAGFDVRRLPYSLRILLENLLRHEDGVTVTADDVRALASWTPATQNIREIAFTPARVLLQDFTGVPALVDLAAMRDAIAELGGDPKRINPQQPVELVIDHSVQVDAFGTAEAFDINEALDYQRNSERYRFIKWGSKAFSNFIATPPNAGICHQVNLEYLARVVFGAEQESRTGATGVVQAFPDTVVGTDSHTPMVNGLGVLGWGVGGIEAEAAMLGQAVSMLLPQVVGFRLTGALPPGSTATDLVLTVAQVLRAKGVVGKFVEFYGPGVSSLRIADRATIGNMSPEYGSTCSIFPVDDATVDYLRFTGRSAERVALVEAYMKAQGLFHTSDSPEPLFNEAVELDLSTIEPSISGPRRPQDRVSLSQAKQSFDAALPTLLPPTAQRAQKTSATRDPEDGRPVGTWGEGDPQDVGAMPRLKFDAADLKHGSVVIAAITSCTNTSNPSVMIAAGLLARNAMRRGLRSKPWVKTSLAPGSRVVTEYYDKAGLTPFLEALGFHLAGYGCTTCIGNSGPLPPEVSEAVRRNGLAVASVLSGNRNFEGRINSEVRANYLMSPPLVVAFAIAGRIDLDLTSEPLGHDAGGKPVFLRDIWPSTEEVERVISESTSSQMFRRTYDKIHEGDARWNRLAVEPSARYSWDALSTYLRKPPYFDGMPKQPPPVVDEIHAARVLAVLGNSITTDHISPAGSIQKDSPAGRFLMDNGVEPKDFNSYGARRGNHEVMVRGTFANVRIRNLLVPDREGPWTRHLPTNEVLPIYDAAMRYAEDRTPLLVLAGNEYGSGSSRDWAAKGVSLLGVRAVIAEGYERIHRSNLVGMGVLPLQFGKRESLESLALNGDEVFDVLGLADAIRDNFSQGKHLRVTARAPDGRVTTFDVLVRIDTPQELRYYVHGGVLHYVLRQLLQGKDSAETISRGLAVAGQTDTQRESRTDVVNEASIQSFPASDAPAY
jgi:aconitate hydratase